MSQAASITSSLCPDTSTWAQLDLMQKIRDNKIFENRSHFQKHAAQPLNFSSFQIQEYLKASDFRYSTSSCSAQTSCVWGSAASHLHVAYVFWVYLVAVRAVITGGHCIAGGR